MSLFNIFNKFLSRMKFILNYRKKIFSLKSTCSQFILKSACPHVASGFCAICTILASARDQAKIDCVHVFTPLNIKAQHMGIMCDFSGGDHCAVIHMASKVFVCDACNAISCIVCLST